MEERIQEMGDFLGILFCYADKMGIDMDAAARSAMVKLRLDFPGAYEDEA
jgi:NTP pyrophosphatase (non-canonical NTP hydrolase)